MAILKKIENDELYLYINGSLVYKRWLNTGHSKVFDVMAYDKYTLKNIEAMVKQLKERLAKLEQLLINK